jgi:hypothetical protein
MHAYGRPLRSAGDLRLLALPVDDGRERYCVADGLEPLVAFAMLERALAACGARCAATADDHRRQMATVGGADLTAYRRRLPAARRSVRLGEGAR